MPRQTLANQRRIAITTTPTGIVAITDFVRRQTRQSKYSHYEGSIEELALPDVHRVVTDTPNLRVISLIDTSQFRSAIIAVNTETHKLTAEFNARQAFEQPLITVTAEGEKGPAKYVELVLYSRDSLAREGIKIDRDWGLVSINCSPYDTATPMKPETMARNMLGKEGCTHREYTAVEFAESVWFWSRHANVEPAK